MRVYNLNAAIARRDEVTELYLHNCGLEHIPPVVFGMPMLKKLDLSANQIAEIPPQIGQLRQLRSLSLHFNRLEGLPPELFHLEQLTELNLGHNRLRHLLPAIGQLQQLQQLRLNNNELAELPDEAGQLQALRYLEVQYNALRRLPPKLGRLPALRQLRAGYNQLSRLSGSIFHLTTLDLLDLGNNRIGKLPDNLGQLQQLTELNLRANRLDSLPESIGELFILRRLLLSGNKLRQLPDAIGRLEWLAALSLEHNKLQQLPEAIGRCARLQQLSLARNQLDSLPASLVQLESLEWLDISDNAFRELPLLPPRLEKLIISDNKIRQLPERVQHMHHLKVLEAANNGMENLPEGFGQLEKLEKLKLNGNRMPYLPQPLFFLPQLESLDGPADAKARKKLLRFLKLCQAREVPGRLRLVIYDIQEEGGRHLGSFPTPLLLEALGIGMSDVAYPIRRHLLFERSSQREITGDGKHASVYLMGETGHAPDELKAQLAKLGLRLVEQPDEPADYLVLGRVLHALHAPVPTAFGQLLSRPAFTAFLNRRLGRSLGQETRPAQLGNLRNMLFSSSPANRKLALQLLQSSGVPRALLTDLFLAWKLDYEDRPTLENLLLQNVSEEALRTMYYPLGLAGRTSEATLTTNIIKYTEDNEFDGQRIAEFLHESFGSGHHYLRNFT
ncbi:MAG: hypothetical protein KDC66_05375 [Phaeodactylibacter sp.]|nr:hypothetical protein [Phaeodactylibacter sp.]MCB9276424.1 hypothetical protein [Lewinellaceae bacterium]